MPFSQSEEEKYILEYFKKKSSLSSPTPPIWVVEGRKPAFCDIGANDGVTFSNTRALALTGEWVGVLVEPSPKAFERLKKLYNGNKGFYVYPFALSDHNGKGMLQESSALCSAADIGLVSTFNSAEMERFKRTVSYEPVEVKTFKWKTFLNRLAIREFDFISVDCSVTHSKTPRAVRVARKNSSSRSLETSAHFISGHLPTGHPSSHDPVNLALACRAHKHTPHNTPFRSSHLEQMDSRYLAIELFLFVARNHHPKTIPITFLISPEGRT